MEYGTKEYTRQGYDTQDYKHPGYTPAYGPSRYAPRGYGKWWLLYTALAAVAALALAYSTGYAQPVTEFAMPADQAALFRIHTDTVGAVREGPAGTLPDASATVASRVAHKIIVTPHVHACKGEHN